MSARQANRDKIVFTENNVPGRIARAMQNGGMIDSPRTRAGRKTTKQNDSNTNSAANGAKQNGVRARRTTSSAAKQNG